MIPSHSGPILVYPSVFRHLILPEFLLHLVCVPAASVIAGPCSSQRSRVNYLNHISIFPSKLDRDRLTSVSSSNTVTRTSAGWEWECEKPQTLPLPCPLTTEWQDAMRSRKSRRTSLGCGRLAVDLQPTFVRSAAHGAPSRPAKNPRYDSLFANRAGVPALVRAPHKPRRMALRIDGLPIAKRPVR